MYSNISVIVHFSAKQVLLLLIIQVHSLAVDFVVLVHDTYVRSNCCTRRTLTEKDSSSSQGQVVRELRRMEQMGVITSQIETNAWIHKISTKQSKESITHCSLLARLSPACLMQSTFQFKTPIKVSGEESSTLWTFITPMGRYHFLHLPFGISSASQVLQRSVAQMIEGLGEVVNVTDDLLVWGDAIDEHDQSLRRLQERARENNLKPNVLGISVV